MPVHGPLRGPCERARDGPAPCRTWRYHGKLPRRLLYFYVDAILWQRPRAMKPEVQKHVEYASGYLDLKMYDDAVQEADIALHLTPNLPQAIALKSAALWQANRLSEAEP